MLKLFRYYRFPIPKNFVLILGNNVFLQKCYSTNLRKKVFETKKLHFGNTFAWIHIDVQKNAKNEEKNVIIFKEFENAEKKDKYSFYNLIRYFDENYNVKTGQTNFIEQALKHLKEFGVHRDLKTYKKLLNLFPKKVFVSRTKLQIAFMKYPVQQMTAIDLLDKMEYYGVIPDVEILDILTQIFGRNAHPTMKCRRMLYWSVKFKNKSPWLLPKEVPSDPFLLGKMAVERITSVDLQTEISIFRTEEVKESVDKTWIVSAQSKKQKELLKSHSPLVPVIVEGGDYVWLRDKFVNYFVLKANFKPRKNKPIKDPNDFSQCQTMYFNPDYIFDDEDIISIHDQDTEIIYAVCVTGTSSKDSLLSWIRILQNKGNPLLEKVPILFRFKNPETVPELITEEENESFEQKT